MIRWKQRIRKLEYIIADSLCLTLSSFIGKYVYFNYLGGSSPNEIEMILFILVVNLINLSLFNVANIYRAAVRGTGVFEIKQSVKTIAILILGMLFVSSVIYLANATGIIPQFVLTYTIVAMVLICLQRILMRQIFRNSASKGTMTNSIIIVGYSERGQQYINYMKEHEYLNMKVGGYVHIKEPIMYDGIEHLGELKDLSKIARKYVVDEIAVARSLCYDKRLSRILNECQDMGITITMILNCKNVDNAKAQVAMYGSLPTLKFHTVSLDESQLLYKRMIDIVGSVVGLIFFGIAFIIFAPLIKLETPGPVIFKQNRVGKNGRVFEIWKFRSMGANAEKQKTLFMVNNEMTGHMFKIENDSRITKIGSFIRKTSIDELPQFWNVFKGNMSLVGTRPPTVEEVKNYETHHCKRIAITPGITGKWQVSGRNEISDFEEVVRLDTEFIENWTVGEDIKIILKTVLIVFTKRGAR